MQAHRRAMPDANPAGADAIYFILLGSALPDTLKAAQGNAPNLR
jgi:hypothetical protein